LASSSSPRSTRANYEPSINSRAQNKDLSDSPEAALSLQGIGFLTRKAIGLATVQIDVNAYEAPPSPPNTSTDPVYHIDIEQTASGISGTKENRNVDGVPRPHSDWLFGTVNAKSTWVSIDEIDDDFLKKGWLVEDPSGKEFLLNQVENEDAGWTAAQVWGFQTIGSERRYVRHVVVKKGDKRETIRMIYDYLP
jgi:hypothetical protein